MELYQAVGPTDAEKHKAAVAAVVEAEFKKSMHALGSTVRACRVGDLGRDAARRAVELGMARVRSVRKAELQAQALLEQKPKQKARKMQPAQSPLSAYEVERLENIERNQREMAKLGLWTLDAAL